MRPDILNPLFAETGSLEGVGPKLRRPLERLGLTRVRDVLYHVPERFVERRAIAGLAEGVPGEQVVVALSVREHLAPRSPRAPFRMLAVDDRGDPCTLAWFGKASFTARKQLPVGERRWVAGKLERYEQSLQIVHPDHVAADGAAALSRTLEPVYRLAEGLTQPRLMALAAQALARMPRLEEWIDPALRQRRGWPGWREALTAAHQGPAAEARERIAYDELFANALAMKLVREASRARRGQSLAGDGRLSGRLTLPFAPTGAQRRSIAEIAADMAQAQPMLRLLQGDVGSGKTLVALEAMLIAVEAGAQAALLAPLELLARQHHATLRQLAAGTGVEIALLTGRDKGRARAGTLMGLADGSIDIVVGTHALFQEEVAYRNLGLVVIDEQHRFGVSQRLQITRKGKLSPHVLAMTATPIPRTLTLARYGEMEVSRLDEMPPGRQPIDTRVIPLDRLDEVVGALGRHIGAGQQAYWVCPTVHGGEGEAADDLAAAQARHAMLSERFGGDVAVLVHGQLPAEAKDAAMARFVSGAARLLVATTVIEVGVDVPGATLMVIEQAERFGLAQLHQLRGRVGRGAEKSTCLLLRGADLSETGKARLALMRESQDGFFLAEEDLRLRGGGELLGTRQSGVEGFRHATLEQITRLAPLADEDARLLIEHEGGLDASPRGAAARNLLYLMERDWGVQTLRGG